MFEKIIEKPLILEQLEVLERRVSSNKETMQNQLANFSSGYYGEKSIEYYLRAKTFSHVKIFNNIRIPFQSEVFQIDFLLLTRNFIWLLECKNMKGNLKLDKHSGQFTRHDKGFINPIFQVDKQANLLTQFLLAHNYPPLPILTSVIIPKPSTIISSDDKILLQKFIYGYQLEEHFKRNVTTHSLTFLSPMELNSLSQLLLSAHKDLAMDWQKRFSLNVEDIQSGVQCENCQTFGMKKRRIYWGCDACGHRDSFAHVNALRDYCILFGNELRMRDCCDWLHLRSDRIARYLLKNLATERSGINKSTVYKIDVSLFGKSRIEQ